MNTSKEESSATAAISPVTPNGSAVPDADASLVLTSKTLVPLSSNKSAVPSSRIVRKYAANVLSLLRKAITMAAVAYVIGCIVMFVLPLFRQESLRVVEPVMRWLHFGIDPVLGFFNSLFSFNAEFMNFNFFFPMIATGAWLLQLGVTGRLEWLENYIAKPLRQAKQANVQEFRSAVVAPQNTRMSLLRDYAASKQLLSKDKKDLAFLSVDVVGSTKMKIGEDKFAIEHAFAEYKKFLERIFRDCRCWKVAWTPDGVMTCFLTADDAAAAGRRVLIDLDFFNNGVHHLRTKFQVRCGLNAGEVMFPEDKPLELVSDEVIDIAGHMQKYAETDALWVSGEVHNRLQDRADFVHIEQKVDNRETFVWRKPPSGN